MYDVHIYMQEMKDICISVDHHVITAGQVVSGRATLQLSEAISAKAIGICVKGRSHCNWTENHTEGYTESVAVFCLATA